MIQSSALGRLAGPELAFPCHRRLTPSEQPLRRWPSAALSPEERLADAVNLKVIARPWDLWKRLVRR